MAGSNPDNRVVTLQGAAPRAIEWAAERLAAGGVVALPTDTVYGIAASLSHPEALRRLFAIKGRPPGKPVPVLISSSAMVPHLTTALSPEVGLLLDHYWPGPLTVLLPARDGMPPEVLGDGHVIGLRVPNHPLAIEVIERAGGAVACTSANRSGLPPACSAHDVAEAIGPDLDMILDGGRCPGGVVSTVIGFTGDDVRVLREGVIPGGHVVCVWRTIVAGRQTP
ncbi:MAG: L-threonylcarbamoyladenylate synthase [Thermomicrobiales bacterium]